MPKNDIRRKPKRSKDKRFKKQEGDIDPMPFKIKGITNSKKNLKDKNLNGKPRRDKKSHKKK